MNKLLIYGLTKDFGGVEKYIIDRLPFLTQKYGSISFAFPGNEFPSYENLLRKFNCDIVFIPHLTKPYSYYRSIRELIHKEKFNVVYCNIGFANAILYLAIKNADAKLIVHSHNTQIDIKSSFKRIVLNIYHLISRRCCTHLINTKYSCSKAAGRWLFGDDSDFIIKKNAILYFKFKYDIYKRLSIRKKMGYTESMFIFGHVGRFTYQKNHEFLIKIFYEFYKMHSDSKLLLIGSGNERENIEKMVKNLRLQNAVVFMGNRTDVPDLMQAMDIFVLPSRFEGLPVVGIEAQAAGLPTFFSDSITREVGITKLANFMSINESPKVWANEIAKYIGFQRKNMYKEISSAGYCLEEEIK